MHLSWHVAILGEGAAVKTLQMNTVLVECCNTSYTSPVVDRQPFPLTFEVV